MAIERMKKLTILFPAKEGERVEEWLYAKGALHLDRIERDFAKIAASGSPVCIDDQEAAEQLSRVKDLLAECNAVHPRERSFLDAMLPVKAIVPARELNEAMATVDVDALHSRVREKAEARKDAVGRLNLVTREGELLREFDFVDVPLSRLKALSRTFFIVAEGSPARIENLSRDREAAAFLAWEVRRRRGERVTVAAAGLKRDEVKCGDILRAHGFRIMECPDCEGTPAARLEELRREEEALRGEIAARDADIRALLPEAVARKIECLNGHWESENRRAVRANAMICSRAVGIARGYARASEAGAFADAVEKEFPGSSVIVADPDPSDNVPVSITLSRWARPGQLLINMFGLPNYFTFDPTPFLLFVFLAFFGICFADVVYGALLIWCSWKLMKRYRGQENLREFFHLFLYCGVSTVIFGVLTGSWAADLYNPEYLGKDNILLRLVQKTTVLDMLAKPVIALMVALSIGVLTQFYGIVMRMLKDYRQKNWQGVLYDGVLWLTYLGGLLVFAVSSISGAGGAVLARASIIIALASMVGLILTQGRDQKGWAARLVTGFVSLYGILGGYGTTSFVGDVLSYSRLLALGLNTYIVGMSFNIIAKITPQIMISMTSILSIVPFLAPLGNFLARVLSNSIAAGLIIALVMIGGHLFNFSMSILSAFVHSARLILLEFFGRFYQGDGRWFEPHGFSSESVQLDP
ncbi:MAG: hypothetical protein WCP22_05220 [Chlamydiota bacterium]